MDLKNKVLATLAMGVLCSSVAVCQAETVVNDDDTVEVVVTAERMPSKVMSTPADVTVITAEDIEAHHYADVAEALSNVNGVLISSGQSNGDQEVIINGEQRVVVLIDGQRLNNDQGSNTRASVSLGMLPQGYYEINQKVSEKAWKLSYELLKSRMKNGGVTFFDATFMSKYLINYVKDLAHQYRYETLIINFNSVGLDEAKRRNAGRWGTIRYVPDYVLDDMWSEGTSVTIEGVNVVDYKDVEIIHFK